MGIYIRAFWFGSGTNILYKNTYIVTCKIIWRRNNINMYTLEVIGLVSKWSIINIRCCTTICHPVSQTWEIKQTIFYGMYSISTWARRERQTRIYDIWPCNSSLKPIATCSDFWSSRTAFTGEKQNTKPSFYARGNEETNWIHHKCLVLYELSLQKYRDTDIKDRGCRIYI